MSWRKYGGTNKLDQRNNITVNTIVADKFTVRQSFLSEFQIQGDFSIYGNALIEQRMTVREIANIANLDVSGNTTLSGKVYLSDMANPAYLIGGNSYTIGINKFPGLTTTLDISSNLQQTIDVRTSQLINRNILARNISDRGIALYTNGITESSIQFYSDASVTAATTSPDAKVSYTGGNMVLDTNGDIKLLSTTTITNRSGNAHISNETLAIYDTLSGTYRYDVYNDTIAKTGTALTLVAQDNNSNTQMNIMTPDKHGMRLIGGVYPLDKSRGMAVIDVSNSTPSQMIVTGNSITKYHSTIGINTYTPKVDEYVMDINGPIHVNNSEVTKIATVPFEIKSMSGTGLTGIAIGTPYTTAKYYSVYRTVDGGETWTNLLLTGDMNTTNDIFTCSSVLDSNRYIIAGRNSFMFYTNDGGNTWNRITGVTGNFTSVNIMSATKVIAGHNNGFSVFTMNFTGSTSYTATGITNVTLPENVKTGTGSDGINAWIVYNNYIRKTPINFPSVHIYNLENTTMTSGGYKSIDVYNSTHAVAVGTNMISYTVNDGTNWIHVPVPGVIFNSVYIHDEMRAIAVGDAGAIYITSNGYKTWEPISDNLIHSAGYKIDRSLNISSVYAQNASTIMLSSIKAVYTYNSSGTPTAMGSTYLYHAFMPYLFNRENTSVMDLCGNMKLSGDLEVNNEGKIRSNNLTFDLLKDTVNTINMGLASTATTIGATSGNTFVRNKLRVADDIIGSAKLQIASDASLNAKLFTAGDVSFNQKLTVGGNVYMKGALVVDGKVSFTGDIFQTDISHNIQTSQQIDISNLITGTALTVRQYGTDGLSSIAKFFHGDELAVDFKHGGDVSLNNNLYVSKTTDLRGIATVSNSTESTSQSSGALLVKGGVGILKNMNVGGIAQIRNLTDSTNVSTGALVVDGGVGIGNKLTVGDNTTLEGTLLVKENVVFDDLTESFSPSTGAFIVKGGVGIQQKVNIAGITNISNTTISSSKTTGALQVAGGVGIGGNTYVGGIVFANNTTNSSDTSTGALVVTGGAGIAGAVNIGGATKLLDSTVSNGTASGALQVTGGVGVGGAIFTGGAIVTKITTTSTDTSTGALIVSGGAGIMGATNIGGQTKITDSSVSNGTASGAFQVMGGAGIGGNTNVGGIVFAKSTANSTNVSTGSLVVSGGVGITGSTNIGGILKTIDSTVSTSTESGALQVTGGAGIGGNTYVGGIVFANNTTTSSNVSTGSLVVSGGAGISGQTNIGGTTKINDAATSSGTASGALQVTGGVGVGGSIFTGGNIVTKATTVSADTSTGALIVNGGAGIMGATNIGGATKITDESDSTSATTGAFQVTGGAGIGGNTNISGIVFAKSTTSSANVSTGSLIVSGGVGIAGPTNIGGILKTIDSTVSTSTESGALQVTGGAGIGGNTYVGGIVFAKATTTSSNTSTGALVVSGGAGIAGNANIGGITKITDTTASTGTASGALQVTGGVGVGGAMFIDRELVTKFTATSLDVSTGALIVSGGAGIAGTVNIGGMTRILDSTSSTGTASGALQVKGGVGIGENVNIGGITEIKDTSSTINKNTGALIVSGGVGVGENVYIGGTKKSTSIASGALVVEGGAGIKGNVNIGGTTILNGGLVLIGNVLTSSTTVVDNTEDTVDSGNGVYTAGSYKTGGGMNIQQTLYVGKGIVTDGIIRMRTTNDSTSAVSSGALQVVGGAGIGGNIYVGGNVFATATTVSTDTSTGSLIVSGGVGIGGNANIAGYAKVFDSTVSTSTASGALQVVGGAGIGGNLYVGGNMFATATTVSTDASTGSLIVRGGAGIGGNAIIAGTTKVFDSTVSTSTASGAVQIVGGAGIGGNVYVGGDVFATATTASTDASTGSLQVRGGAGIIGAVNIAGSAKVFDSTVSTSTVSGALQVVGGAGIGGNVYVGGNVFAMATTVSTDASTGSLIVRGGAGIGGNMNIAGYAKVFDSTVSTSTASGAVQVVGGAGVGGNVYVGGNVFATATTTSANTSTGSLVVSGGAGIGGATNIAGLTKVFDSSVSTSTASGALQVVGGASVGGNVYVGGNVFATATTVSTDASTGSLIVRGGAGIGGNAIIAGVTKVFDSTVSTSTASGAVQVVGGAGIGGSVYVGGNVFATATTASTDASTGSLIVSGGAGIGGNAIIAGLTKVFDSTVSASTASGALQVVGGAGVGGNVYVGGNVFATATTVSTDASTGSLQVCGGAGIIGAANIAGVTKVFNSTVSTSTASGALQVVGGAGIGGNVYAGGGIFATAPTASNDTSTGSLVVSGGVGIAGTTNIGGRANINSVTNSTDTSTGALVVIGGAGIQKDVNVGGAMTINSSINSTSRTTGGLIVSGGAGIGGNLFVGGNTRILGGLTVDGSLNIMSGVISTTIKETVVFSERVNITNEGTGPGLVVRQNGTGLTATIAEFYDDANLAMSILDGGNVSMNYALSVGGIASISNGTASTTTGNGALVVGGGVGIGGNVYVGGNVFATATTASNDASTGALVVRGGAGIGGAANIVGLTKVFNSTESTGAASGAFQVVGGAAVGGNIYVGGNVFSAATTTSNDASTGALVVRGGAGIGGAANIVGLTKVFNSTESTGAASGAFQVVGGAAIGGNIYVGGNVFSTATTASTDASTGSLVVRGGAGIGGNAIIAGVTKVFNSIVSTSTASGGLQVVGGAGIGGNVYVGGNVFATATTVSTDASTGSLIVRGGAGIGGNAIIAGVTKVFDSTVSTSTASGGFQVVGGAGIGGNVYVGGNVFATATTASTDASTGSLQVRGGAGITGAVNIAGAAKIFNSTVSISTSTGALQVVGGAGIRGNVFIGDNLYHKDVLVRTNRAFAIDFTTGEKDSSFFYPIEIQAPTELTSGAGIPIEFTINAQNMVSLYGYVRPPGLSASLNPLMYDFTQTNLTTGATDQRFLDIYYSTANDYKHIVIYARGGYKYTVITNGFTVSSSPTTGTVSTAFATSKNPDVTGSDAVGTSTAIASVSGKRLYDNPNLRQTNLASLNNNTTVSTSTASGALQVVGGAGIGGNLNVGGNLNCSKINNPFSSDKLATDFIQNTAAITKDNWYRIAFGNNGAASWGATIIISINELGNHQYLEFKASYQYGFDYTLTVLNNSVFNTTNIPISAVRFQRITEGGESNLYWNNYIEIKVGNANSNQIGAGNCKVYMTNNLGTGGLTLLNFTSPAGTTDVIYEKDLTNCIFSVGRDTNLNMINVVEGTTTLTNATIAIAGNSIISSSTASTTTSTGALQVKGGAGIIGNVNVGGILETFSTAVSTSTASGALQVVGGAGIGGNVYVGGNIFLGLNGNVYINGQILSGSGGPGISSGNLIAVSGTVSTSTTTGALIVSGGAGITGNVNVGGILETFNSTESTSTATGALQVMGGAGIAGNVYVGGNINLGASGNIYSVGGINITSTSAVFFTNPNGIKIMASMASTSTDSGALQVVGGAGIGGNVYVGGSIFAGGGIYSIQLIASNSTPTTLTSVDGKNWSSITTSFGTASIAVNSIAQGGTLWMAGLNNGTIVTSLDGITWSLPKSTTLTVCNEVVWSPTLNMWFAGGGTSATVPAIMKSTNNGVSWSAMTINLGTGSPINGLVWDGTFLVGGSAPSTGSTIVGSTDGTGTFYQSTTSCTGKMRHGNGRYIMCSGTTGGVYNINWSSNATSWNTVTLTGSSGAGGMTDVAWAGGNTWMAVTNAATTPGSFLSTDNGSTWAKTAGTLPACNSIVWNSTKSTWVAAGISGGIYWSSDNGVTWTLGTNTITSARLGFSNVTADNVSISTSTGALVVSGGVGISGNVSVGGNIFLNTGNSIYVNGQVLSTGGGQTTATIDFTGALYNTSSFYIIEIIPTSPVADVRNITEFSITGEALGWPNNFNENTLYGYIRTGGNHGWSDHMPFWEFTQRSFDANEHRFYGIYSGTQSYMNIVIYARGGYKYYITTNGNIGYYPTTGNVGGITNGITKFHAGITEAGGITAVASGMISNPPENYFLISGYLLNTASTKNRTIRSEALEIQRNEVSTSTTTGSLIVSGGAGIGGNVYVGGNIIMTNANDGSTRFGYQALNLGTGAYNTAIGSYAGSHITTGSYNALIGFKAGLNVSTTAGSIAIGSYAMGSDAFVGTLALGSWDNICIGNNSGKLLTGAAAAYNLGIGGSSLGGGLVASGTTISTTGENNVCVGDKSGAYLTTGNYNTGLGTLSLGGRGPNALTGHHNICLGHGAGGYITGAAGENIIIGVNAGGITTGSSNVVIGHLALSSNTLGTNNTCIGHNSANGLTSGINNTALGSGTVIADGVNGSTVIGVGATVSVSNQIVLGRTTESVLVPGTLTAKTLKNSGADFVLWDNGRGGTGTSPGRALVHMTTNANSVSKANSQLYINIESDFGAGTVVDSNLKVNGTLRSGYLTATGGGGCINMVGNGVVGELYITYYPENATTRRAYIGFPGAGNKSLSMVNEYDGGSIYLYSKTATFVDSPLGLKVNSPTVSTTSQSGALQVVGGAGILQNLNVGGNVGIGSGASSTAKLRIYEATGSAPGIGIGTLLLEHGNSGGTSSIVFASNVNYTSDHAYISYRDASLMDGGGESSRLIIGVENDADDHIILSPSGNVGISNNLPSTKLHVGGDVTANSYNATSDSRIKTNILSIDSEFSLDLLRKLNPSSYNLIEKPDKLVYGFIAQQVNHVIPEATFIAANYIPSIYENAFIEGQKITLINKTTDLSWKKIKITNIECRIISIIDERTMQIDGDISKIKIIPLDISGKTLIKTDGVYRYKDTDEVYNGIVKDGVFVYGPEVQDFHSLNNDTILAVTTSATQELDKQLQDARQRITTLENQVSELMELVKTLINK